MRYDQKNQETQEESMREMRIRLEYLKVCKGTKRRLLLPQVQKTEIVFQILCMFVSSVFALMLFCVLSELAYMERGYRAVGGEYIVTALGGVIYYIAMRGVIRNGIHMRKMRRQVGPRRGKELCRGRVCLRGMRDGVGYGGGAQKEVLSYKGAAGGFKEDAPGAAVRERIKGSTLTIENGT